MDSQSTARRAAAPVRHVLVTGGAGFIGARVVAALLARGLRVHVVDDLSSGFLGRLEPLAAGAGGRLVFHRLDVSDARRMGRLLAFEGPFERVLHLAGRVGVRRVLGDPEAARRANLEAITGLHDALGTLAPQTMPRLFNASTSEVYRPRRAPLREDDPLRSVSGRGRWAYAAAKRAGEQQLDAAAHLWKHAGMPVHLRLFNVVGPGQDAASGMVLPTFVEQALEGRAITVHGNGAQVRSFAHVDEVAEMLVCALLTQDLEPGALNIGGLARCSVVELAAEVARCRAQATGVEPPIAFVDPRQCVSPHFEEIDWREPSLERARHLGLPLPALGVRAIVEDAFARHQAARAAARATGVRVELTERGARSAYGGPACVSLAS